MKIFNIIYKTIGQIFLIALLLSTLPAKSLERFDKAESVSDYFSGTLLLNDNKYEDSLQYLKKLNGLEKKTQKLFNQVFILSYKFWKY